ncbi:hypothetical protein ACFVFI_26110 [Streptomyces sp. NPDC057705]|uniref:hypothetical protein n=1 Tax=Streptomyces sp. NPDC057705 TaxID=3346222 RepID=UPI0036A699D3
MIAVAMPSDIADLLVAEGLAIRPGGRGSTAEITLVGIQALSATISLLQGPDTFLRLTELVRTRFGRSPEAGGAVEIRAHGAKVTLEIPVGADALTVARRIQELLVGDDE